MMIVMVLKDKQELPKNCQVCSMIGVCKERSFTEALDNKRPDGCPMKVVDAYDFQESVLE